MPKKRSPTTYIDSAYEYSSVRYREAVRKLSSSTINDEKIPIPIQTFLWRQSNPFLKQKFGKLTEASATIFNRILVQNILHGLSPSLTDAISSVPRWLFIKAAFPHVMHACASIIEHDLQSNYHQQLLFPATHLSPSPSLSACTQLRPPSNHQISFSFNSTSTSSPRAPIAIADIRLLQTLHYLILYSNDERDELLSLNTIQLFIYLFLPYIHTYFSNNKKEFDANPDLLPGMTLIWRPLLEYHQPDIPIFKAFVRGNHQPGNAIQSPEDKSTSEEQVPWNTPLICTADVESKKEDESKQIGDLSHTPIQAPLIHMSSICSISDLTRSTLSVQNSVSDPVQSISDLPRAIPHVETSSVLRKPTSEDLLLATYFDIGILRTLFSPAWLADGYIWCLEYLHKRLVDISDEILSDALADGMIPINLLRLKSLSSPQIHLKTKEYSPKYLQKTYFNEQLTNELIQQQYTMTTTLLNLPMNYPSEKLPLDLAFEKSLSSLVSSRIHYIDEEPIEHLDLAHLNRRTQTFSSSKNTRVDPNYSLLKSSIISQSNLGSTRQSADGGNNTRKTSDVLPTANLTSSSSDSQINYRSLEAIKEVQGSSHYVNRNGTMNFSVILAGIHAVVCKEYHLKSCELIVNILDVLLGLAVISSTEDELSKRQIFSKQRSEHMEEWFKQMDAREEEKFQLAVDIILRILKYLGCSNCQVRARTFSSDQLRGKIRLLLNKLRLINEQRFEKCFLNFSLNGDLIHVFDMLHALCGYCAESNQALTHYAPYISTKTETSPTQTYTNHFGNTHLGNGPKGIDGFLLKIIFKPFLTRLNTMEKDLFASNKSYLYSECRAFLMYIKENHGGIFRLASFSSLIDPEQELRKRRQTIQILSNQVNESLTQEQQSHTTEQRQSLTSTEEPQSKEHSLYVDLTLTRRGLLRFSFLLESCPPGSLPDPQFLNSLLFLDAPVICKAAFLIECAHYISRCSLGHWPEWMRANSSLNKIYRVAAARMFYIWGEALSSQLETVSTQHGTNDQTFDDYYNEAIINPSNHDCPYSLQLIVCLVLYEITVFLRETYQTLPKLASLSNAEYPLRLEKTSNIQTAFENASMVVEKPSLDRLRTSSIISEMSVKSSASLSSEQPAPSNSLSPNTLSATILNMNSSANERHISFARKREDDSYESNHTVILMNENDGSTVVESNAGSTSIVTTNKTGNTTASTTKPKLNRRSSTKLRKLSTRIKDLGKITHRASIRTRRRSYVSNLSTDTEYHPSNIASPTTETNDGYLTNIHDEFDDMINTRPFPWIQIVIKIFNHVNLDCHHKQRQSCENLLKALLNMYQSSSAIRDDVPTTKKQRVSTCLFGEQLNDVKWETTIHRHFQIISTYLEKQVRSLLQIPLMILCKSSTMLDDENYSQILPLSWAYLLDQNEELAACAATIVILTGARASHLVHALLHNEMNHPSTLIRSNSILKFQILWRYRYQFWIRLEENAHSMIKILPPSIEFVLPSPALGIANLQTVDPPWMPHVKTLLQQVTLNQEEVRTVVTTSKTRKKHQQELLHSALTTEETSKRVARENCSLSSVAMLQAASFEPILHQIKDDDDEGHTSDEDRVMETSVPLRQAHGVFPSAFSQAIFDLVDMLEDEGTLENGAIVSGTARKVLWTCLRDEPTLLIRFFFEKLSHKERRITSLRSLRSLMLYLPDIPPQFAHAIFNYVLGLLVSMTRSPIDGSQELIRTGLTLLWQIIPYLHGLVLKDLKQILRKEQAEMMILITGNIPSTKKVIIHGLDVSQIPTQAIIGEETQFSHVLQEALEFFGIPDSKRDRYHLIDIKTQQVHIPDTYVRDFYFFRRNIYPQFSLVYMDRKDSQRKLDAMAIELKTVELSKVLFARYLLENTPFNQMHNSIHFFHDELIKSPLFPRKPLEFDLNLNTKTSDMELLHLDMIHKYNWIRLITCMFFNLDGKTSGTCDITLFLPIINGSFMLHCEDLPMLRYCLATYINIVRHFRHIFATNGYLLIMPTVLRVYSNMQSNPMVKKSIEYCCRQFFILHRIPFILQMLGSVSQLLDFDEQADVSDTNKIQPKNLFRLLIALEQTNIDAMHDDYAILELVRNDSLTTKTSLTSNEIKSLDFCYEEDETVFTLLNCFDVCVTVIAYAPDSIRSLQMLGIIDLLLPKYLEYIKDRTNKNEISKHGRNEMKIIEKLSVAFKTMINALESFTRAFVGPKHDASANTNNRYSRTSYRLPSIIPDEDSTGRFLDERTRSRAQDADDRKQASEFRWPRDTLLSIISTFLHFSTQRSKELIKSLNDPTIRIPELLDIKAHTRLADITHTLLKLGSFDPVTISCRGIQSYFQKFLPYTNWSDEQLRPGLNLLLRRIDRMFLKICKKPMIKRCFDWEATAGILNGIYLTIQKHPSIAYFPNYKTLISGCISLILNENLLDSNYNVPRLDTPIFPKEFSRVIIKLVGQYLLALKYQPNLETLTNNSWSYANTSSSINNLLHFILPLLFEASTGRKDAPKLHPTDISYILTMLLSSAKSPSKLATTMGTSGVKQHLTVGDASLPNNHFVHKTVRQLKDLLQIASLLGLKILIIGFGKQLKREWHRIFQAIKSICQKQSNISTYLLSFIDFLVSSRTPIYIILRPFLSHYMYSVTPENDRDYHMVVSIQQKIYMNEISSAKSAGQILNELLDEVNHLEVELTDEPKSSNSNSSHLTVGDRVRFDIDTREVTTNRDGLPVRTTCTTIKRSSSVQSTRLQRQQSIDRKSSLSPRKRTGKIRLSEALDIMNVYHTRYRLRSNKIPPRQTTKDFHRSISISRSTPVTGDGSNSNQNYLYDLSDQFAINTERPSKLRTFRGWKRATGYFNRSSLNKSVR